MTTSKSNVFEIHLNFHLIYCLSRENLSVHLNALENDLVYLFPIQLAEFKMYFKYPINNTFKMHLVSY